MLSSKLIRLVEDHGDSISASIINEIRSDSRLPHVAGLPEAELRDRAREILRHLDRWLTAPRQEELAARFETIGRTRCEEGIPLHEVVLSYLIIKDRMLEFVRGQGIGQSAVDIYAEEELEHVVGRMFDSMIFYAIRGYEDALQEALQEIASAPFARKAATAT
jgi:hypothetical protein